MRVADHSLMHCSWTKIYFLEILSEIFPGSPHAHLFSLCSSAGTPVWTLGDSGIHVVWTWRCSAISICIHLRKSTGTWTTEAKSRVHRLALDQGWGRSPVWFKKQMFLGVLQVSSEGNFSIQTLWISLYLKVLWNHIFYIFIIHPVDHMNVSPCFDCTVHCCLHNSCSDYKIQTGYLVQTILAQTFQCTGRN